MHYVHTMIYESMYLFVLIQFDSKFCIEEDVLLDDTFEKMAAEMGAVAGFGFISNRPVYVVDHVGSSEDGVHLTWQDLSVTASNRKDSSHVILAGLTGYVQPGQVLAIMGPSGCGKSTLLDALAGRLGSNVTQSGHILVNGRRQRLSFGASAYVTQEDILMTTLTVREAVYYSAELQLPNSMSKSEKRERADMTIVEMGLKEAMDTRIGGYFTSKGISGGQKRRVSICIEILTRPKLLFLDEPTSGLDSAASFHVMNRIVNLARHDGVTVLASIHQPSSEVFELFDNLCLLSSGKTIYFGPTSDADQVTYWRKEEEESSSSARLTSASKAIDILSASYKQSKTCQEVLRRVNEISSMEGAVVESRSQASFLTQLLVLTKRSMVNMNRDLGYYWLRFAIYLMLSLTIGTIFFHVGHSYGSIQARGGMLMFIAGFLTFMAIGGFPSFAEDMKIFRRERLNGHYGVTVFVLSNTFSSAPYLALLSLVPGVIAYYLVGLQRGIDHFLFFCSILYASMLTVEGIMMIIASLVPNYLLGIISGAGIQGTMIISGGFFRLPGDLPKPVWKYPIYELAFHKYANQGYYKNEFLGLTFPSKDGGGAGATTITGEEIVRDYWQMETYSKWVDLAILFAMVVIYRVLFLVIVKITEKLKPVLHGPPKKAMKVMEQPLEDYSEPNP
ncbi:hypothetical protein Cni_G09036 [Canna indica]|uniref:ABC transporter domain-containing protein n=1 Tax=Canna indica TaxID=4628 RepID=A0AAQ3K3W7_9LILI|nr:hypothetical protein Cni_G09036 [Canna indica]